jgi:hypothetical protein
LVPNPLDVAVPLINRLFWDQGVIAMAPFVSTIVIEDGLLLSDETGVE